MTDVTQNNKLDMYETLTNIPQNSNESKLMVDKSSTNSQHHIFEAKDKEERSSFDTINQNSSKNQSQCLKETMLESEDKKSGRKGRGFFERTFKNYNETSMRAGIMFLFNTGKGAGCLSIPIGYAALGMAPGTLIIILGAINMIFTYYMMNRVQMRNMDCHLYTDLVKKLLGPRNQALLSFVFLFY